MTDPMPKRFAAHVVTEEVLLLRDLARALEAPLAVRNSRGQIILTTADLETIALRAPIWGTGSGATILLGSLEAGSGGVWKPATLASLASELSRRFQGRVDDAEQEAELNHLRAECHLLRRLTYLHVRDADTLAAVNAAMEEVTARVPDRVLLFWEAGPQRMNWSGWCSDQATIAEWLVDDVSAPERIHAHLSQGRAHSAAMRRVHYTAVPVNHLGWVGFFRAVEEAPLTRRQIRLLDCLAAELANLLARERQREEYREMLFNTVRSLVAAIEAKDPSARGHSERVYRLAILVGRRLGLPDEALPNLSWAALLHDIGKLAISSALLCDPDTLSPEDFETIKTHPERGCRLLEPILQLRGTLPAIRHHHERFDGSGYPEGLSGEAIPLEARILAIADTYEAILSSRAYREAAAPQEALAFIQGEAGTRFDPRIVAAFLELAREGRLDRLDDLSGPTALDLPGWSPGLAA